VAVNWNVVEVVTSSWGFLWIVFAAGARIVWKIHAAIVGLPIEESPLSFSTLHKTGQAENE
jgi:hypothetical protein